MSFLERPFFASPDYLQKELQLSDSPIDILPTRPRRNEVLHPSGWPRPKGYANGIKARGDLLFIGGLVGWDEHGRFPADFVDQTRQLLRNIAAVLAEGGAAPRHIVRMTWYVRDMDEYLNARPALGEVYREVMGDHYPAMALVAVTRLVEPKARLEIETTAVVPE
jgi:enamine deaminase RidA (YjgF/YER057c/UK114 family)